MTFLLDNVIVSNPGNSPYKYDTNKKDEKADSSKEGDKAGDSSGGEEKPPADELNVHDPNGGLMEIKDKKAMIDLKCDQILKNPDDETNLFGPDYPTKDVNYSTIIARCPANCHTLRNINVYGLSIHPSESPICMSAIVDHAISLYGGIFSISLFSGYDKYLLTEDGPKEVYKIPIKPYGESKKSYVLAKIDNVDMVEKDLRILDGKGKLAPAGRVRN